MILLKAVFRYGLTIRNAFFQNDLLDAIRPNMFFLFSNVEMGFKTSSSITGRRRIDCDC